jgi:hypothetical protein
MRRGNSACRQIAMMLLAIRRFSDNATPIRNVMTNTSRQLRVVRNCDSMDALVREVAQRSAGVTRSRLHLDADQLTADELRGYVRARAIGPVRQLMHELAAAHKIPADQENQLVGRALERTVHLVVREMCRPIVATPPVHLPLRAAA